MIIMPILYYHQITIVHCKTTYQQTKLMQLDRYYTFWLAQTLDERRPNTASGLDSEVANGRMSGEHRRRVEQGDLRRGMRLQTAFVC